MTNLLKPKFAYYVYKLPETTMIFVDYTCKETIAHTDLQDPIGLVVYHKGNKYPVTIVDCYGVFNKSDLIMHMTKIVKELSYKKSGYEQKFECIPCASLSKFLASKMTKDCKEIFRPNFNARIDDAINQIKSSATNLAEQRLANSFVKQFDNISD
jgi:hypothetical protein